MKICEKCGFANKERALVCKNCSELLSQAGGMEPTPTPTPTPAPAPAPTPIPMPDIPVVLKDPSNGGPNNSVTPDNKDVAHLSDFSTKALGKYRLVVEQGLITGKSYWILDPEVRIGRTDEDENCFPELDLSDQEQLGNYYISRKHACLSLREQNLYLKDVGSSHGTRVNQTKLTPHMEVELKVSDRIILGERVVLRLLANENV